MSWSDILDWVVLASVIVMLGTFIFDLFRSYKDNRGLKKDHEILSKEHDNLKERMVNDTNRIITQNDSQSNILNEIYSETKKRDIQYEHLTLSQKDAYEQMQKFTFLLSEVSCLQSENTALRRENSRLEADNRKLKSKNDILENQRKRKTKRL